MKYAEKKSTLSMVVAVILLTLVPSLRAQEPLRWKLEKGEKFDYDMVQEMTFASEGSPQGNQSLTMHQEFDMTWDVQDVTPEGDATIQQKINQVKVKMALPAPAPAIEYDTSSTEPPAGPAAGFASMYKAMTQGVFVITMTPRGEIKDIKVPDEVLTALKNSPGAAAMGDMATAEGFKKMMSQGSLVLPEKAPAPGETWSSKVESNHPMAGKQTAETTYQYEGTKEVDGVLHAVFRPTIQMSFEGAAVKINEQTSSGEILFNVPEGRLASYNVKQQMAIDQPGGGQVKIEQIVDIKVKPAGEVASESASEARSTEAQQ